MQFDPSDLRAVHLNWWYYVLDKEMPWTTLFWKPVGKKEAGNFLVNWDIQVDEG